MAAGRFEPDMLMEILAEHPGFAWANAEFINPETLRREGVNAAVREAYRDRNLAYAVRGTMVGRSPSEMRPVLEYEIPRPPKPNVAGLPRKEKEKVMDAYYRRIAEMERRANLYLRRPLLRGIYAGATPANIGALETARGNWKRAHRGATEANWLGSNVMREHNARLRNTLKRRAMAAMEEESTWAAEKKRREAAMEEYLAGKQVAKKKATHKR